MIVYNSKMLIEIMFKSIYESLLQINRVVKIFMNDNYVHFTYLN